MSELNRTFLAALLISAVVLVVVIPSCLGLLALGVTWWQVVTIGSIGGAYLMLWLAKMTARAVP